MSMVQIAIIMYIFIIANIGPPVINGGIGKEEVGGIDNFIGDIRVLKIGGGNSLQIVKAEASLTGRYYRGSWYSKDPFERVLFSDSGIIAISYSEILLSKYA